MILRTYSLPAYFVGYLIGLMIISLVATINTIKTTRRNVAAIIDDLRRELSSAITGLIFSPMAIA